MEITCGLLEQPLRIPNCPWLYHWHRTCSSGAGSQRLLLMAMKRHFSPKVTLLCQASEGYKARPWTLEWKKSDPGTVRNSAWQLLRVLDETEPSGPILMNLIKIPEFKNNFDNSVLLNTALLPCGPSAASLNIMSWGEACPKSYSGNNSLINPFKILKRSDE